MKHSYITYNWRQREDRTPTSEGMKSRWKEEVGARGHNTTAAYRDV